jgi:hypothetical protein
MLLSLKQMLKDAKEENERLKLENYKIKKATKYTKIQEMETQRAENAQ